MIRILIKNWRCIDEAEISLNPITIFIGGNSTGKSSLAYAPYFLSKVVEWRDVNKVLMHLYGGDLDSVVRRDVDDKRYYPIIIKAGESSFEARDKNDVDIPDSIPWSSGYLLPSPRLAFIKISQFIPKLSSKFLKSPEGKVLLPFAFGFLELIKNIPMIPPLLLFLEDLMKLYGIVKRYKRRVGDIGILLEEFTPLMSLLIYKYEDVFTGLRLPLDHAPDGFIDTVTIKMFVEKAGKGSVLVIEEPEINKNPIMIIDLMKELVGLAIKRRLTVIITTHSDILLHALAKTVEEGLVKHTQLSVYYLMRDRERPWTRIRELKVYEDGTFEELPGIDRVVTMLF